MEKQVNVKSTKNEILDAYAELLKKVQTTKEESPQKRQEVKLQEQTITKASGSSYESIVKGVSELKMNLSSSLDKIEDAMIEKQKQLTLLQEAIDIQQKNLQELYQINTCADSLSALMAAQREQKARFEEEITSKKEAFEKEIAEKKLTWQKEQVSFEQSQKEQSERLKNDRKREEEEYAYNLKITRKKEADTYQEQKQKLDKELEERKFAFENEIKQRETQIASAEKELENLRQLSSEFPAKLEVAVQQARENVTSVLQTQYKYERELAQEKISGELKLKDQLIVSLNQKIKELEMQVKQLTDKSVSAENSVKDIALKALETSSARIYEGGKKDNQAVS